MPANAAKGGDGGRCSGAAPRAVTDPVMERLLIATRPYTGTLVKLRQFPLEFLYFC